MLQKGLRATKGQGKGVIWNSHSVGTTALGKWLGLGYAGGQIEFLNQFGGKVPGTPKACMAPGASL